MEKNQHDPPKPKDGSLEKLSPPRLSNVFKRKPYFFIVVIITIITNKTKVNHFGPIELSFSMFSPYVIGNPTK